MREIRPESNTEEGPPFLALGRTVSAQAADSRPKTQVSAPVNASQYHYLKKPGPVAVSSASLTESCWGGGGVNNKEQIQAQLTRGWGGMEEAAVIEGVRPGSTPPPSCPCHWGCSHWRAWDSHQSWSTGHQPSAHLTLRTPLTPVQLYICFFSLYPCGSAPTILEILQAAHPQDCKQGCRIPDRSCAKGPFRALNSLTPEKKKVYFCL